MLFAFPPCLALLFTLCVCEVNVVCCSILSCSSLGFCSLGCSSLGCSSLGCDLLDCSSLGCCLSGCSLSGCSLSGCSLLGCSFLGCSNTGTICEYEVIVIGLFDNNGDLMHSHYDITCELACHRRQSNSKQVTFRKLKSIGVTKFRADIHPSYPSLSDTTGSAIDMIERYSERLTSILDIHAPIIHRIVIPRPNAPWYTSSLHIEKRKRRTLEQRW